MKIQLHFPISFHFKNNYRESICDPYYKNEKFIAQKNCKNLNQKIIMNFSLILFVFYFQMFVFLFCFFFFFFCFFFFFFCWIDASENLLQWGHFRQ